jgi:tRNA nucleotidyltransferase (CCA-adding enzyme)
MQFYPAGETIARRLLSMPLQRTEWVITGARASEVVAAGFQQRAPDQTRFVHPESGDLYQLARHQYFDEGAGQMRFICTPGVTLENELATRPLTILAMASDGDTIIDPFDGQDDLVDGVLRHVAPDYVHVPQNLLATAVWAARLRIWGFRVAHSTFKLMKRMAASAALEKLPRAEVADAVMQALESPRPSEFFRVLHRCGALAGISRDLDTLFEPADRQHGGAEAPREMQALDRAAAETDNLSTVIKRFYQLLGNHADRVFSALGLAPVAGAQPD